MVVVAPVRDLTAEEDAALVEPLDLEALPPSGEDPHGWTSGRRSVPNVR